ASAVYSRRPNSAGARRRAKRQRFTPRRCVLKLTSRLRPYRTLGLIAADALLINVAFAAAYWARYIGQWLRPVDEDNLVPFREYIPIAAFLTITLLVIYKAEGVYSSQRGATWLDRTLTIFNGTLVGIAAMIVVFFFLRP